MLNNLDLMGRLVETPELKTTKSGKSVTTFRIANETGYGEYKKTNWLTCTAWGSIAETVSKYFTKGSRILITGRIETREFETKDGQKRTATEIIVTEINFIDKKDDSASTQNNQTELSNGNSQDFIDISDDEDLPF